MRPWMSLLLLQHPGDKRQQRRLADINRRQRCERRSNRPVDQPRGQRELGPFSVGPGGSEPVFGVGRPAGGWERYFRAAGGSSPAVGFAGAARRGFGCGFSPNGPVCCFFFLEKRVRDGGLGSLMNKKEISSILQKKVKIPVIILFLSLNSLPKSEVQTLSFPTS
jgi:hypothetical protein